MKHAATPRTPEARTQFFGWMEGYCSMFEDLPDGAWQAACEAAVAEFNKQHGTRYDPYDAWLAWVEETSE